MRKTPTTALIVAAGRGTRAGGDLPKQWQEIAGRTVLEHTLNRFETHPQVDTLVVVLHPEDINRPLRVPVTSRVSGGLDRAASVRAGLSAVPAGNYVLIHDAARPCLHHRVISDVIIALEAGPAAAPALPVTDALWTGINKKVTGHVSREGLFRAQTPQGFHLKAIRAAHEAHTGPAADDVEVARAAGLDVTIVEGDEDNLKITYPQDFARAARILETFS